MYDVTDDQLKKEMGERFKAIRKVRGLTASALAKHIGVKPSAISNWETGYREIDILKLARFAKELGFSTDWIIIGDLSGFRLDVVTELQAHLRASQEAGLEKQRQRGRPRLKKQPQGE